MKPTSRAPGSKRVTLENEKVLSNFAFNFNLRRYIQGTFDVAARDAYNNAVDYTGFNIGVWTVAVDAKLPAKA